MKELEYKNFDVIVENGVATATCNDKEIFSSSTENISKETLNEVFEYSSNFINSAATVASEIAIDKFNDNKEVSTLDLSVPYGPKGNGSVNVRVKREEEFRIPGSDKTVKRPDIRISVKEPNKNHKKKHINSLYGIMKDKLK